MKFVLLLLFCIFSISISYLGSISSFVIGKFTSTKGPYGFTSLQIAKKHEHLPVIKGFPHTEESKAKISKANKGKTPWNVGKNQTDETRNKISATLKKQALERKAQKAREMGMSLSEYEKHRIQLEKSTKRAYGMKYRKNQTEEDIKDRKMMWSEKMKYFWTLPEYRERYLRRNHTISDATRLKLSIAIKKKWKDPAYRKAISEKLKSTPEARAKISLAQKKKWQDIEFRTKMLEKLKIGSKTAEERLNLSNKIKTLWQNPEYRNKTLSGILGNSKLFNGTTIKRQRSPISHHTRVMQQAKRLFLNHQLNITDIQNFLGEPIWSEEKLLRKLPAASSSDGKLISILEGEWTTANLRAEENLRKRSEPKNRRKLSDEEEAKGSADNPFKLAMEEKLRELDEENSNDFVEVYDGDELIGVFTQEEYEEYLALANVA